MDDLKFERASDMDKFFLNLLDNRIMSVSRISFVTKMDRQFIKGVLESMRYRGLVKKVKIGRSIIYQKT